MVKAVEMEAVMGEVAKVAVTGEEAVKVEEMEVVKVAATAEVREVGMEAAVAKAAEREMEEAEPRRWTKSRLMSAMWAPLAR